MTLPLFSDQTVVTAAQLNAMVNAINARYGMVQFSQPNQQTIATASTYTTVTGWTTVEIADTIGGTRSSGVYTVPSAMTLEISAAVSFTFGATDYRLGVVVNGSTFVRVSRIRLPSAATAGAHCVVLPAFAYQFNANDTVQIQTFINLANATTTAAATETYWLMRRVA